MSQISNQTYDGTELLTSADYEYKEIKGFPECLNKQYPNGSFNAHEYELCALQLMQEFSYESDQEYNEYIVESQEIKREESIHNEENKGAYDKSSASCLCAFKFCNIFIIFVCLLLI